MDLSMTITSNCSNAHNASQGTYTHYIYATQKNNVLQFGLQVNTSLQKNFELAREIVQTRQCIYSFSNCQINSSIAPCTLSYSWSSAGPVCTLHMIFPYQ